MFLKRIEPQPGKAGIQSLIIHPPQAHQLNILPTDTLTRSDDGVKCLPQLDFQSASGPCNPPSSMKEAARNDLKLVWFTVTESDNSQLSLLLN